ncbi:hypothetical protein bcgnr5378_22950 [Bacillus cereus]|uniref:hypothetical protein n=1 Tax=Bacillus cereus group TaxID=86661 RepID=UPI00124DF771|nr:MULTISPECIES: hypothetical protein [Bacillus cereus group]KAB2359639.1 hypothetical protein F8503_11765 [Bacillus toyonensis]BCC45900.1 hypothetical protein BCJMU02_1209 [Bacillus cereus]HDR4614910.1 hypothetical protein [Bacillus cereus]HDR4620742.1 hypothetical protein [Bacillus cereus]
MEELKIYRNELKNTKPPKYKLIGIVTQILLSTELFKNNIDTKPFLKEVFNKDFNEYVYGSRTLIIARTIKLIQKCDDKLYLVYKNNLYKFIVKNIDNSKSKNNNTFDGWL